MRKRPVPVVRALKYERSVMGNAKLIDYNIVGGCLIVVYETISESLPDLDHRLRQVRLVTHDRAGIRQGSFIVESDFI